MVYTRVECDCGVHVWSVSVVYTHVECDCGVHVWSVTVVYTCGV